MVSAAAIIKTPTKNSLVGYWSFNDNYGTKAGDASGNGNTGTLTNSPTWTGGKFGKALSFNGSSSYVVGSGSALSNVGTAGNVTISAWIKPNTVSGQQTVFSKGASGSCFNYGMTIYSGGVLRGRNSTNDYALGGTIVANQWQHLSIVFSPAGMQGFINGVSIGTVANTTTTCADNNWVIGTRAYNAATSEFFSGLIDDVRVYNRALAVSEIITIYKSGTTVQKNSVNTNLLGYWPLNGDYGDYSGKKNNFTVYGTCLSTTTDAVTGRISITNWATCGTSPQKLGYLGTGNIFNSATELTFVAWVKGSGIVWSGAPTFWFTATASGAYLQKYTGSWVTVATGSGGGTSSGWRQLVVTKASDGGIKIYSNTTEIASSTTETFYALTSQTVGRYAVYDDSGYHFTGKIDDIRLYNKVLSQSEINELYKLRAVTVNSSQNDKIANGLVGLWSFDGKDMNWATNKSLDRSGQGNDGTLVGMSTTTSPTPGKIGSALKFDGSDDYISVNNTSSLQPLTGNWAVSFWIYRLGTGLSDYPQVVGSRPWTTSTDKGWAVSYSTASSKIGAHYADGSIGFDVTATQSTSVVPLRTWQHWVVVFDRTNGKLNYYLNGQFDVQQSPTFPSGTINQTDNLYMGREIGGANARRLNATIDDVRVYNRALSATEIKQLYNLGR